MKKDIGNTLYLVGLLIVAVFAIRIFWPVLVLVGLFLAFQFFQIYRETRKVQKEMQKQLNEETETLQNMYTHQSGEVIDAEYVEHDERKL